MKAEPYEKNDQNKKYSDLLHSALKKPPKHVESDDFKYPLIDFMLGQKTL